MTGVTTPVLRKRRRGAAPPSPATRGRCARETHTGDWVWAGPCEAAAQPVVGKKELSLPISNRPPAFFAVSQEVVRCVRSYKRHESKNPRESEKLRCGDSSVWETEELRNWLKKVLTGNMRGPRTVHGNGGTDTGPPQTDKYAHCTQAQHTPSTTEPQVTAKPRTRTTPPAPPLVLTSTPSTAG